jgi:prepilin signal peptidase PulO-like enzyme (type II secretory pathway)
VIEGWDFRRAFLEGKLLEAQAGDRCPCVVLLLSVRHMKTNLVLLLFILFSINSVVDDLRTFSVRSKELAIGIGTIIAVKSLFGDGDWIDGIVGGSMGALVLALAKRVSKGRLGSGDIWFSALIGFSFGFWAWDACIIIAAVLGMIWIGLRRSSSPLRPSIWHIRIPFAPFMFVSAIMVFIYKGLTR